MIQTILVVEDQDDISELAALILRGAGYVVHIASSGEEGLRLLAEHPVDLVLLDIMMPGISGWEVCRRIRDNEQMSTLPIVVFTVGSTRSHIQRPEYAMVNGFVNKPFNRHELLATVRSLLAEQGEELMLPSFE